MIIITTLTFGFHGRIKTFVSPFLLDGHSSSNNNHNGHTNKNFLFSEYIQ